jgi:SPP1 family predicted phage head-tail adaptor
MEAGKLRHRLVIEAPQVSQDTDGGQLITWEPQGKPIWGSIEPLRNSEQLIAAQVGARQTHRLTLRYVVLPTEYRLALEGTTRIFEPTGVRNIEERDRMLEVLAVENVREG